MGTFLPFRVYNTDNQLIIHSWIETLDLAKGFNSELSHLLQMRGLKPLFKGAFERVFNVASFTGTTIYNIFCKKITGLKYLFVRK